MKASVLGFATWAGMAISLFACGGGRGGHGGGGYGGEGDGGIGIESGGGGTIFYCSTDVDCDDKDPCTTESCVDGQCDYVTGFCDCHIDHATCMRADGQTGICDSGRCAIACAHDTDCPASLCTTPTCVRGGCEWLLVYGGACTMPDGTSGTCTGGGCSK